jgi:hypothetical protein
MVSKREWIPKRDMEFVSLRKVEREVVESAGNGVICSVQETAIENHGIYV